MNIDTRDHQRVDNDSDTTTSLTGTKTGDFRGSSTETQDDCTRVISNS